MYNFKQVLGKSAYKPWKQWEAGEYLVGKFVSESTDKFGNPNYKVEVIETNFEENAPEAGEYLTLNSSGSLKKAFEDIEEGQIVKVIYKGEDTVATGKFAGKAYHSMEVLVADKKTTSEDSDELI